MTNPHSDNSFLTCGELETLANDIYDTESEEQLESIMSLLNKVMWLLENESFAELQGYQADAGAAKERLEMMQPHEAPWMARKTLIECLGELWRAGEDDPHYHDDNHHDGRADRDAGRLSDPPF